LAQDEESERACGAKIEEAGLPPADLVGKLDVPIAPHRKLTALLG
jgi:hypothetical protein